MHTDTGRIFPPEQVEALERAAGIKTDADREAFVKKMVDEGAFIDARDVRDFEAGKIVPVSNEVVQKIRLGERELARRKTRRKAARDARRRNR